MDDDIPTSDREAFTHSVLGGEPSLTAQEVARDADTGLVELRRLWRALGFPDSGSSRAFTDADVEAVGLIRSFSGDGIDDEAALSLTRALGNTMARLADWQVSTLAGYVERAHADATAHEQSSVAKEIVRGSNDRFEQLLVYAWRRHLAVAAARLDLTDGDDDPHTVNSTAGFIDLVGFTELSTGLAEGELADLVERFESTCADIVTAHHGRVVKTLGDSVLFLVPDVLGAVEVATTVVERVGGDPALPDVHVGMATGPIVLRLGDVFGSPINMASRLTGLAQRNRVLCDAETARALADEPDVSVRAMSVRHVRGFGPVEPYTVRWRRRPDR